MVRLAVALGGPHGREMCGACSVIPARVQIPDATSVVPN